MRGGILPIKALWWMNDPVVLTDGVWQDPNDQCPKIADGFQEGIVKKDTAAQ